VRGSVWGSIGHGSLPRSAQAASARAGEPRLAAIFTCRAPRGAFLLAVWLVSLAAIALGLDGILGHPPFLPIALVGGAYWGALSATCLAEEVAEWRLPKNKTARLPCLWRGRA
jgi:hypothetical protein